jgi:predicted ABC-type ATPase
MRPAELVLVAGPNGSGKSTVVDAYIQQRFPLWPKLNADRVARALLEEQARAASPQTSLEAASLVDATARCLALLQEPFVLETVCRPTSIARWCPQPIARV